MPGTIRYIRTKAYTQFGIPGIVALLIGLWAIYSLYKEKCGIDGQKASKG